ncbi:MAG TPA: protein phosphatase CheZ [Gammaproteobacteria bacterium]|nr:protein phosphatase CheZ [Gammaproteobacteria bacterium]
MIETVDAPSQELELAQQLVEHIKAGNSDDITQVFEELASIRETTLFQELGKLTREFHETLNSFRQDIDLANMAEQEFPDAKERLNYVITMTQQAADRTLNSVEGALPLCDSLTQNTNQLKLRWKRFQSRELSADEFRSLVHDIDGFLDASYTDSGKLKEQLNDILMAQDYQDLTGQIIRKVIGLVDNVEKGLVNLIKVSGARITSVENEKINDVNALEGPQIPSMKSSTAVNGQDEVDDLLSSLGF